MPISSLIIKTQHDKTPAIAQQLGHLAEVQVTEIVKENIVIITDTDDRKRDKAIWEQIEKLDGVVQCDLIYHNFEDTNNY